MCKDLFSLNIKDIARKHTWIIGEPILAKAGCKEKEIILNISTLSALPAAVWSKETANSYELRMLFNARGVVAET